MSAFIGGHIHNGFFAKDGYNRHMTFSERVFSVVRAIPKGHMFSYKEVAQKAGSPRAYRAVGNILNKNFNPKIPCHRVVRSDGSIGGYNRGCTEKRKILRMEFETLVY